MTDPEPTSDFGYDLVHEDPPRPDRPGAPGASHAGPPSASRMDDDSGADLGYDDAHDF
jgi:hypothetical protein